MKASTMRWERACVVLMLAAVASCGKSATEPLDEKRGGAAGATSSSTEGGATAGGDAIASGGASDGGDAQPGDVGALGLGPTCLQSDAVDCSEGPEACATDQLCLVNALDGCRHCTPRPLEAESCPDDDRGISECCATSECAAGTCLASVRYVTGQCGGGGADLLNRCLVDACQSDADCGQDAVCAWSGDREELHLCLPAFCRSNADCDEEPGGRCVWTGGECVRGTSSQGPRLRQQLACAYPGTGCRQGSDCGANENCVVRGARTECSAIRTY
jgi:hypothetical protein